MDTFDNIEDSIRRHEEQLDANALQQRIEEIETQASLMPNPTMPDVMRSVTLTTTGKFCLIVLATLLLVQVASALGAFALMVGASILLAVRFAFWVAIAVSFAWMLYQLIKNP